MLGLLAAITLLGLPSMTLYSLASYEAAVCGLGLCLWRCLGGTRIAVLPP